ncbi:SprT family protein [Macrococcoides caseolyticum]|uniref:SprT family protein n=1 Tax=Macrococcoides caseolyticum TaxID=69966 RepID=UPI001F24A47C|nr:SprT family protein [Macrococcus caseolyticus]MCE4957631.1 SprT family protein [Macrococcus caseolyticus]
MQKSELQSLVEEISLAYFDKPFIHEARFNHRLRTTGGRYLLNSHDIEINPKQYDTFGIEAIVDIIKHELVHYHLHIEGKGYQHRDKDFKVLSEKVGAPRFCEMIPSVQGYRYTYTCNHCGQTFLRKRRVNTRKYKCSKCLGEISITKIW